MLKIEQFELNFMEYWAVILNKNIQEGKGEKFISSLKYLIF